MAYRSYLVDKFDTTHENKFFRKLDKKFKETFTDHEGDHIFIGNLNVEGNKLDALFLRRGALIVIDFKDYCGDLTFSLNGPWRIKNDQGQPLFVSGGAHSRNPFQQVNAYRFSLFKYLSNKSGEILDSNHTDVSWDHTSAWVLFQREVKVNIEAIPAEVQRFFNISTYNQIVENIIDVQNEKLNFSKTEISNILKVLNITDQCLYKADEIKDEVADIPIEQNKINRIIKLIPDLKNATEEKRALGFYKTMLAIERINQSTVRSIYRYSILWDSISILDYTARIENNKSFLDTWLSNKAHSYPKNLFVSINVLFEGLTVPLFFTVFDHSDVEDDNTFKINFDSFDLYQPILEELQLTDDLIEELNNKVNDQETLQEKIKAASEYLELPILLADSISLGLSEDTLYTVNLQSELNQWINDKKKIASNPVFDAMLTSSSLSSSELPEDNIIYEITPLNESQKKAVKLSFNQFLTTVTGPPGTGKSQVVTNILANAVIKGEKVLFSSKNNKAVDNVHERISELLNTNYFLRLGTGSHNAKFVDNLTGIIDKINGGKIEDREDELKQRKEHLDQLLSEKGDLQKQLSSISILEKSIPLQAETISKQKIQHSNWISSLSKDQHQLYIVQNLDYNFTQSTINELERIVSKSKEGLLGKLNFKIFKKSEFLNSLKQINSNLSVELQKYIDNNAPLISRKGDLVDGYTAHLKFLGDQKKLQEEIKSENQLLLQEIGSLQENLEIDQKILESIKANKPKYVKRIAEIAAQESALGLELLDLSINEKLRNASISVIETYKNYVKNGFPWRFAELKECQNVTNAFLEIFNCISITSLNIKKGFLQETEIFDLLVIDEASQNDITSALPLIYRAKRVVIIGDSLQLPHITSVKTHEQNFVLHKLNLEKDKYNYIADSLFQKAKTVSNLSLLDSAVLVEHYRCHPDIIGYSNQYFYLAKGGYGLDVKTKKVDFKYGDTGIQWVDVKGVINAVRNVNMLEVETCINLASILAKKFPEASIGIATPFRHQKEELKKALADLPEQIDVLCDVIHNFQGDEKDIMILSLVVTENCKPSLCNFINVYSPYLLNVGVTRAKSALYIVGNKQFCSTLRTDGNGQTLLSNLVNYENLVNS